MSGATVIVLVMLILVVALRIQSYRLEAEKYYRNKAKVDINWLVKDTRKLYLLNRKKEIELEKLREEQKKKSGTSNELLKLKNAYYGVLYELELAKKERPFLNAEIDKRIVAHFDYEVGVLLAAGPSAENYGDFESIIDTYNQELTNGQRRLVKSDINRVKELYVQSLKMQEG